MNKQLLMMYILIRQHLVPIHITEEDILKMYQGAMSKMEITLTSRDIDREIRKRYRREEMWHSVDVTLEYELEESFLSAILAETMNDDIVKRVDDRQVKVYNINKTGFCPVCLDDTCLLVLLHPCSCTFCEKCIKESVKYSDRCPLCYSTINDENPYSKNDAQKEEKTSNKNGRTGFHGGVYTAEQDL